MKKYLFLFSIFLACSSPKETPNKQIADYYESLTQMDFPLTFNSNYDFHLNSTSTENDTIISKLIPAESGFRILGKLFKTDKYYVIIGFIPNDFSSPILISFDNNGNKIDSFAVYQTAGFDIGYYRSNYAKISNDKNIEFIDSTLTRQVYEDGSDEIPGTDSLNIKTKIFEINKDGFIEEEI